MCSRCSIQKSNCEQIAPGAIYKRETKSESIPSIFKKNDGSDSLFFMSESLFRSQKLSNLLIKTMIKFPTRKFLLPEIQFSDSEHC